MNADLATRPGARPGLFRDVLFQRNNIVSMLLFGMGILLWDDGVDLVYAFLPAWTWVIFDLGLAIGLQGYYKPWSRALMAGTWAAVPVVFLWALYVLTPEGSGKVELDQLLGSPRFWILAVGDYAVYAFAVAIGICWEQKHPKRRAV